MALIVNLNYGEEKKKLSKNRKLLFFTIFPFNFNGEKWEYANWENKMVIILKILLFFGTSLLYIIR